MKIAFITTYDSSNIQGFSGSGYYILQTLKQQGFLIKNIGNLKKNINVFIKVKDLTYRKLLNKNYMMNREPKILKSYAYQVERRLQRINPDIVFSPGNIPISYLNTDKPLIIWTDATFAGMIDFYPEFSNLCKESLNIGMKIEQMVLSKCKLAIFSSQWAAKSAIDNYDVNPQKIKIVPFGANINCDRTKEKIIKNVKNKNFSVCKLLFIGVNWYRKGGDMAIKVTKILNHYGIKTELHIVGCFPPYNTPNFVKLHGFISKNTKYGMEYINKLFTESHFLILPSKADCVPVVLAEASSFGLPSLVTNVGGISTAIKTNINGKLFQLEDKPEKYCDYIIDLMSSKKRYQLLALSSFKEYINRLNWKSAGEKIKKLIVNLH